MAGYEKTIDSESVLLLRKIVEAPFGLLLGVKAIKFRADNHQNRNLIDSLLSKRFIDKRDEKYFVTLIALPEIFQDALEVEHLISWCEIVFRALRQAYLVDPGSNISIGKLGEITSLTIQQVATCIPFLSESSILGGWTTDIYASDAYVCPSERILDYESFSEIINEHRGWILKENKEESKSTLKMFNIRQMNVLGAGVDFSHLLHSEIIEHALPKFQDGHYRNAVLDSVIAVFDLIRKRTGLLEDGDELIGKAFSLNRPYLVLSEIETDSGKNDQKGFMQIFKGVYQGVRNPKAHSLTNDLSQTQAAQYLVFSSLLARRIEEATLVEPEQEQS